MDDRAGEFSAVSRPIIAGEASKAPGVESSLRRRCNAHIRSFGAIKEHLDEHLDVDR